MKMNDNVYEGCARKRIVIPSVRRRAPARRGREESAVAPWRTLFAARVAEFDDCAIVA